MANRIDLETINEGDLDWASKINRNWVKVRDHTHDDQNGTGFEVNLDSVSCVSDISFKRIDSTITIGGINAFAFSNLSEGVDKKRTLFVRNHELCFSNGIGITVQITANGTLNVNTVGGSGFTGNLSTYGAHVDFTSATSTYQFFGNAGSATTINCGDVEIGVSNFTNVSPLESAVFRGLEITNFAPVANGRYLLHGTEPYNPQLIAQPFSLFATTFLLAQQHLAQVFGSGVQRAIQTNYTTTLFCYRFRMLSYISSIGARRYSTFSRSGVSNNTPNTFRFPFTTAGSNLRGYRIMYSCYSRNAQTNWPKYGYIPNKIFYVTPTTIYPYLTPLGWTGEEI